MQWKYNSTYKPAIFLLMACAFPEYFLGSKWPPNKYLGVMVNAIDKIFFFTKTPQEQFKNEYSSLECLHSEYTRSSQKSLYVKHPPC